MKIEKDVPLPVRNEQRAGELTLALREMEVGNSVLVTDRSRSQIASAIFKHGRRLGRRFVQRRVEGGQRVWRVE